MSSYSLQFDINYVIDSVFPRFQGEKNVQGVKAEVAGKAHRNAVLTTEKLFYDEFFLMVLGKKSVPNISIN